MPRRETQQEGSTRRSDRRRDSGSATRGRRSVDVRDKRGKVADPQQSRQAKVELKPKKKSKSKASHIAKQSLKDLKPKRKLDIHAKRSLIKMGIMAAVGVGIIVGIYYTVQSIVAKQEGFVDPKDPSTVQVYATQVPRPRNSQESALSEPSVTPNPEGPRDISFGARDIVFEEKQINQPGIYDTELLFSAGTGSLDGQVLTKLYLYNLDTGEEELIETIDKSFYMGEMYETQVNHAWLVWLETDHGEKNYIMAKDRGTGKESKLKTCKNGQPKLRLNGNILIWMEQTSTTEDRLYMVDLTSGEDLSLETFTDKATYGVSAPCIFDEKIVWAGPDKNQSEEEKEAEEHSGIYYQRLSADESGAMVDTEVYYPGTYVHEPLYNGDVFVWLDGNKSPSSKLYMGRPGEEPIEIVQGVTTYSVGDGIICYGKDQAVWVYIIKTGELCRLTSPGETGMMPKVTRRTVVWYNLDAQDKDVLRYKILTDEELYPGGNP